LATTWKNSGRAKKFIIGGLSTGNTTRFLSINLRFKPTEESPKASHNLCLTTLYFPHSGYKEKEIDQFNNNVSNFLSNILSSKNTTPIIGADTHSSIGVKSSLCNSDKEPDKHESHHNADPILKLLDPHGNPASQKQEKVLLTLFVNII
jgi:hypothetical protein